MNRSAHMLTVVKLGTKDKNSSERIDQILKRPIFGSDYEEILSVDGFKKRFPAEGHVTI